MNNELSVRESKQDEIIALRRQCDAYRFAAEILLANCNDANATIEGLLVEVSELRRKLALAILRRPENIPLVVT